MKFANKDSDFGSIERLRILRYAILAICLIYIGRLGYLQIIQGNRYKLKAEAQAIKQVTTEPFRGMIYDRYGRAIVQNSPGFSITITPYEFTPEANKELAKLLNVEDSLIWQEVRRAAAVTRCHA